MTEKTGPQLLEDMALVHGMDEAMRRDGAKVTDEDVMNVILAERQARAQFVFKQRKAQDKKQGIVSPETETDTEENVE